MKPIISLAATAALILSQGVGAENNRLVLLHTNDTHSQIFPNNKNLGGVERRMVLIDSVRNAADNVVLIDAGDAVQGTLFFTLFGGEAERKIMNEMGYDIRILGNHEFDNGLEELAANWKKVKGTALSSNYDFSGTPAEGIFKPWVIKKIAGKKIGFMALNIDPRSLIVESNYTGMKYRDVIQTADSIAAMLRHRKGCDLVVALTHIGYSVQGKVDDVELARQSRDIDIIIGGHSHTLLNPDNPEGLAYLVPNAEGQDVLIAQAGKSGLYVGRIEIDLDRAAKGERNASYSLIPVTDRFAPETLDKGMTKFLGKYKAQVDSVNARPVARVAADMSNGVRVGAFPNWAADFGRWYGHMLVDSLRAAGHDLPPLDLSIMNVGGIRSPWSAGTLTEGQVLSTFPFSNHMVLMKIKGKDLIETMRMAARKGGEAISSDVRVVSDAEGNLQHVIVDGREVDPDRDYLMTTIDYLAWGNDDMTPLAEGEWIHSEEHEMVADMMRYITWLREMGMPVEADPTPRFIRQQ